MAFVSELIGRPVVDAECESVGEVKDVIAVTRTEKVHPEIIAILVHRKQDDVAVPIADVAVLLAPSIPLPRRANELRPLALSGQEIFLDRDILDRQIIDTDGVRVVRVNDLDIARVKNQYFIANVDISQQGLFRRLLPSRLHGLFGGRLARRAAGGMISWDHVELLHEAGTMRLKVPSEKIAELHPADLAEIISDLTRPEGEKLLETLDVQTVADTLEEVEPDFQASLLQTMSNEKVADVLEEMAPDEAADLLAELPEDRSEALLKLMKREEADDVRKLLTFPVDSAGGLMNTEFFTVPPNLTASAVITALRKTASEAETIFYVYVAEPEGKLIGVFSLRELVMAEPRAVVSKFMHKRVLSVKITDSQEDVAQAVSKYNLLAVPVVDEDGRMQGIVTADDALDKIIPTAWKKRLPRMYH
jgi:magnesium transporter